MKFKFKLVFVHAMTVYKGRMAAIQRTGSLAMMLWRYVRQGRGRYLGRRLLCLKRRVDTDMCDLVCCL